MHTGVGIVTRLKAGLYGVQIPADGKEFSPLQNVQSGYGDHPAPYKMGAGVPTRK
jgi:hypothetical protein